MVEHNPLTRRRFGEVVASLGAALALPSGAPSEARQPSPAPRAPREVAAIENCVQLIRDCQLPNGSIAMRLEREPTDEEDQKQAAADGEDPRAVMVDTIRVVPYFANHSALALLSAHTHRAPNLDDVGRAARWAAFYARAQNQATGYVTDYKGSRSRGTFSSSGQMDSVDAYASTFLQVAERHWKAVAALPPTQRQELDALLPPATLVQAAALSLRAIESVTDRDGLTWARPDYRVKFLFDSVEVYGGLRAGDAFFAGVGLGAEATKTRQMAQRLGAALDRFWQNDRQRFAWAIMEDGSRQDGFADSYPHALANLGGLAWISGESEALWRELQKRFTPDIHAPVERWLMAAIGVGDADVGVWRQRAVEAAARCTSRTNGQRTAVLTLALCEGRSWMPNVAEERGRSQPSRR
jgi:hypothetical protein